MKTTLKIAALSAALFPAFAFAQAGDGPTDAQLQSFRVAITQVGCTIADDATAASVQAATGFSETLLESIVQQLRVYNEIVDASAEGGITLTSGECAL